MRLLKTPYQRGAINPRSCKAGDRVEVRFCDTSASCVWSYPAVVIIDRSGKRFEAEDPEMTNKRGDNAIRVKHIDNCYTYLTKPIK